MTCTDYMRWFSPYVDGILASDERRQLEAHLEGCARCRGELASLQQMLQTLRTMEPPTVPELLPGIHAQLQQTPWWHAVLERFTAPWPASLPWHGLALATSTALVLLIVVAPSYRVRRIARAEKQLTRTNKTFQLAQAPAQASQFHRQQVATGRADTSSLNRQLDQYEPYYASSDERAIETPKQLAMGERDKEAQEGAFFEPSVEPPKQLAKAQHREQAETDALRHAALHLQDGTAVSVSTPLETERSYDAIALHEASEPTHQRVVASVGGDRTEDHPTRAATAGGKDSGGSEPSSSSASAEAPMTDKGSVAPRPANVAEITDAKTATTGPILLQVQWRVGDVTAASAQVTEWISARHGLIAQTNEHHLSIRLLSAEVSEFLQRFATQPPEWTASAEPLWVTISLELIPSE